MALIASRRDFDCEPLQLQLAPVRGEVYREHPDKMNSRLMELDDKHPC